MNTKDNFLKVKHLYNRAGFGVSYTDLEKLSRKKIDKVVDNLLKDSQKDDPINLVNDFESKRQLLVQAGIYAKKDLTDDEKKIRQQIIREQNEVSRDLNIAFITRMINTDAPLREKMTLFWHGHFACRSNNPFFAQQLNNIQRANALGSFKTLLVEVSKSPAMLQYLNNQQNKKGKPNENFARELMELFTLGRGNYSEQDIKESARSFTAGCMTKMALLFSGRTCTMPEQKRFLVKSEILRAKTLSILFSKNLKQPNLLPGKYINFSLTIILMRHMLKNSPVIFTIRSTTSLP